MQTKKRLVNLLFRFYTTFKKSFTSKLKRYLDFCVKWLRAKWD